MEYRELIDECEKIVFPSYENFCAWYAEYEGIISTTSKMKIRIRDHQGIIIYDCPLDVFHAHEEGDKEIICRLTGEDGNAFAIMGRVQAALKEAGVEKIKISQYIDEAVSGDYNNLLAVSVRACTENNISVR